jgi:uncharacterized membrane protein
MYSFHLFFIHKNKFDLTVCAIFSLFSKRLLIYCLKYLTANIIDNTKQLHFTSFFIKFFHLYYGHNIEIDALIEENVVLTAQKKS